MPHAHSLEHSLALIAENQKRGKLKEICLHWCLIDCENNYYGDISDLSRVILASGVKYRINLVRYNPYDEKSMEPKLMDVLYYFDVLNKWLPNARNKIVDRVGVDVKASCGTFLS
jgi:23S rRNA (adenine2503-C2)-methyltransferase